MRLKIICAAAAIVFLLAGCAKSDTPEEKILFAMDTEMTLRAYGKNAANALGDAETEIRRIEKLLTRGGSGSEIYRLNDAGRLSVSGETAELVNTALEISSGTDGAFDITIAPVMDLWGFYTKDFHVPSEDELENALKTVDYRNVSVSGGDISVINGSRIDLGGIAKGFTSGRIIDIFRTEGVKSGIISLGGNVECLGARPDGSPWCVAIQNPDGDDFLGTVSVTDKAVITSGGYQRFFEENGRVYHHIIDPVTGYPSDSGLKSVTVISSDGTRADALSTAFFVTGLERAAQYLRSHEGIDAVFMTDSGDIYITPALLGVFDSRYNYNVIR